MVAVHKLTKAIFTLKEKLFQNYQRKGIKKEKCLIEI